MISDSVVKSKAATLFAELSGLPLEPVFLNPGPFYTPLEPDSYLELAREERLDVVLLTSLSEAGRDNPELTLKALLVEVATGKQSSAFAVAGKLRRGDVLRAIYFDGAAFFGPSRQFDKQPLGKLGKEIVGAVQKAVAELDYAPSFNMGHPLAFEFASRMAEWLPADMGHVFYANSGSEAVDTALKIALAYHRARGEGQRTRLIGREKGYHGVGFGGTAVGGIVNNRKFFGPLLPGVDHLPHTHNLAEMAFSRGQPAWGAHLADELERRRPGMKVLYTSGYTENAIIHHGRLDTGVLLLAKPYRKSDLAGMIRKALGG